MEDGEAFVGILVDSHLRLDEVAAVPLLGDLENASLVTHGAVVADPRSASMHKVFSRAPAKGKKAELLQGAADLGRAGLVDLVPALKVTK